jgi:hypothetical protein
MALPITEALLGQLGFVREQPPHVWGYKLGDDPAYFRVAGGGGSWALHLRGRHVASGISDLMYLIRLVEVAAHAQGVRQAQDAIHQALGLTRLIEEVAGDGRE